MSAKMSMVVARMQKMKSGDLTGSQKHNQREFKNHTNKNIDSEKEHLNYDLVNQEKINYLEKANEIIDSQKVSNRATRKDAVLVNEWIITSNQEFFKDFDSEEIKRFFETSLEYFSEKFGTQNMAYAQVHLDETTPHMHLGIVPMKDGRLSGKTVFDRKTLREIQDDFPKFLQEHNFDIERGIEGSQRKNISNQTYKKIVAEAEKEAQKEIEKIKSYKKPLVDLEKVETRSSEKGIINKRIEVAPDDFEKLILTAKENIKLREFANKKVKENKGLKKEFEVLNNQYQKVVDQQQEINQKLENKNNELLKENKMLNQEVNKGIDRQIIYEDILRNDFNFTKWTKAESKARLVLNRLERGLEPSDLKQGQEWQETLEKARDTNIKPDRLERGIGKIKEIIQRIKEKILSQRKNKEQDMER